MTAVLDQEDYLVADAYGQKSHSGVELRDATASVLVWDLV